MTTNAKGQRIMLHTELGQFDSEEDYQRAVWRIKIQNERKRQIDVLGYDDDHDAKHGVDHLLTWAQDYARRGQTVEAAALIEAARTRIREAGRRAAPATVTPSRDELVRVLHADDLAHGRVFEPFEEVNLDDREWYLDNADAILAALAATPAEDKP